MNRGELRLADGENLLWQCSPRLVPAVVKNRKLLVALFVLWLSVTGWFVVFGDVTGAVVSIAVGSVAALVARQRQNAIELVEYFVTDRRIVVHTDEEGKFEERVYPMAELPEAVLRQHPDGTGTITFAGAEDRRLRRVVHFDRYAERDLVLRAIDHAQKVYEHVRRARDSAGGASAE
ncbi:hypothetical protein [Amycolatopsis vastitatis]|uniref:Uncharacterized protein n=1 Tax=Amycolatopsis vastitatis TaxID=1905142 RepID=A0A229T9A5_9PSEU|nr:hypothetical protein [Amycolatopsis vastitatis]OXM67802.1 hypothetical protein CF165_15475 [Amycolatopsis vastitatis]